MQKFTYKPLSFNFFICKKVVVAEWRGKGADASPPPPPPPSTKTKQKKVEIKLSFSEVLSRKFEICWNLCEVYKDSHISKTFVQDNKTDTFWINPVVGDWNDGSGC